MTNATTLANTVALVTGASSGIGAATAKALAAQGAAVALLARRADRLGELKTEIESAGGTALLVPADVTDAEQVATAVQRTVADLGRLDILVNNAAVFESAPLESLTLGQWDAVFETNARGPFLVAREALAALRTAEGRIVNIGSLGGMKAWAGHAHYCASKAALHMLTQAMAKAFAPEVSVNCVAPGWIELDGDPSGPAKHFAAKTPMRRNGHVEDVAQAVLFFAEGPHFVTGQVLAVDGGLGL